MKVLISSGHAPVALGPFSHGTIYGDLIFSPGELPVDKASGKVVEGGISAQSHQSLTNLKHVLEAGGGSVDTVLKTTCYLSNINDFAEFNKVYAEFFQQDCPARSCFAVKDLPLGVLIEVEAIAHKK
ncbi:Rid family detoxifying hydrolase [Vibrio parahaemolyticus]|uniref:Rid family detoxifying hydrolase n=1 Tax=Vibrio parahaemolyticus TaxID=670 RepID=UPI00128E9DF6|nr:Rid family detoxifying hydrolase [Vibrio parahaemolyticus]MQC93743.1 regulator [Vibrio parahaemolyticus]